MEENQNETSNNTESKPKSYFNWQNLFIGIFVCIMVIGAYQAVFGDKRDKMTTIELDGSITQKRGNWHYIGNVGKPVGKHTEYREGREISEINYNDKGEFDGKYKRWNENGDLIQVQNFSNGEKNGEFKRWNKNGELIEHEIYENDILIEKIK